MGKMVEKRKVPANRDPEKYTSYVRSHTTLSMTLETRNKLNEIVDYLKQDPDSGVRNWDDFLLKMMYPILKKIDIPRKEEFYKAPTGASYSSVWVSKSTAKLYKDEILPRFGESKRLWQPLMTFLLDWWSKQSGPIDVEN